MRRVWPAMRPARFRVNDEHHRVTAFELFFDLVFVFAFTRVTGLMAAEHSAFGVLHGMIVFAILWWAWAAYGWLGNQTFVDEGAARLGMAVAMIATFIIALAIPEAFDDHPGGLDAPLVLAMAYVVVRVVHMILYLGAAGDDGLLRRQVLITSIPMATGSVLILIGAVLDGPAQTWFWLAGLTADLSLTYLTSRGGQWRVHSAAHWAERYGLVVILALGESIVSIGAGVAALPLSVPIMVGGILSMVLSLLLWWLYFDAVSLAAERKLAGLSGRARAALAIDGYTYLHFAIVAGIIIAALGVEEAMHEVDSERELGLFGAVALFGGASLYLAAHTAFWKRAGGTWKLWRITGAAILLALIPAGAHLSSLVALAVVILVPGAVVIIELLLYPQARAEIRSSYVRGEDRTD